jgi:antitoxin component of MazEF toxin-antitoxin module
MVDFRPPASAVVQELGPNVTKADTIRALDRAGYSRSEIAAHMGIRYQHVRNVLVDDARLRSSSGTSGGMAEEAEPFKSPPQLVGRITVGNDGEVRIPKDILDAAGAKEGEALIVRFKEDEIQLITPRAAGRRAQAHVRQYIPEGVSLADELIAERRLEAKRELEDD